MASNALPPTGRPPSEPPPDRVHFSWFTLLLLAAMMVAMWSWQSSLNETAHPKIDYSTFYDLVKAGKVQSVTLKGPAVTGQLRAPQTLNGTKTKWFRTMMPERDDTLLPLLRDDKAKIRVEKAGQSVIVELMVSLLPWVLIIGVWVWLSKRAGKMLAGGGPMAGLLKSRTHKFEKTAQVNTTFDDVAGLKSAKQDLREVVEFLKSPGRFRRLGGKVPRGVLLVGPPGTGKTLLARAAAGESGVPFYSIGGSEFIEMFVGLGAARVRELFDEAKKTAPAIVFIDEIDAVGRSRGSGYGGGNDEREQTLNQLLSEMDGFSRNDMVVVIAATNRPDVLDPALLRPGRFDRRIVVDRPEVDARRAILDVHVRDKPMAEDVELEEVARNTPGFSGADLENLVNEAALNATRRGVEAIHADDFAMAYDKVVLGDVRETKLDPEEKRRVAVHEAGHAVVAHFSPDAEPLHRVTIIPRGMALGVTQQTPGAERHIMTEPELTARLQVLMGGYACESLVFGSVSSGAENDLKEATRIASSMVAQYGMSNSLGAVYYEYQSEHPFLGERVAVGGGTSDATISAIETEARQVLANARREAEALLAQHRDALDRLVEILLSRESIDRQELGRVLGPRGSADSPARNVPAALSAGL